MFVKIVWKLEVSPFYAKYTLKGFSINNMQPVYNRTCHKKQFHYVRLFLSPSRENVCFGIWFIGDKLKNKQSMQQN